MRARAIKQGLAVAIIGLAATMPAARAQISPNETGPSDRFTAAPDSGVIKPPPGEDPGLRKQPPANSGTIKVIPPPGTPGNQPDVVPK